MGLNNFFLFRKIEKMEEIDEELKRLDEEIDNLGKELPEIPEVKERPKPKSSGGRKGQSRERMMELHKIRSEKAQEKKKRKRGIKSQRRRSHKNQKRKN